MMEQEQETKSEKIARLEKELSEAKERMEFLEKENAHIQERQSKLSSPDAMSRIIAENDALYEALNDTAKNAADEWRKMLNSQHEHIMRLRKIFGIKDGTRWMEACNSIEATKNKLERDTKSACLPSNLLFGKNRMSKIRRSDWIKWLGND